MSDEIEAIAVVNFSAVGKKVLGVRIPRLDARGRESRRRIDPAVWRELQHSKRSALVPAGDEILRVSVVSTVERLVALDNEFPMAPPVLSPPIESYIRARQAISAWHDEYSVAAIPAEVLLSRSAVPEDEAAWGRAIGPVFTIRRVALELGWPERVVADQIEKGGLLAIQSDDGLALLPIEQFDGPGPVAGLRWVLSALQSSDLSNYTIAAWLNSSSDELDGLSPWQEMNRTRLSPRLRSLVEDLAWRFATPGG